MISWIEWFVYCKPMAGFWDKAIGAECLAQGTHKGFALMNTSCNILTDIVFATLPVPIIWKLQMALRTRAYLIIILSLGYIAVLIGIVKAVCQNVFRGDPDQSFNNWIQFWGFMQVSVGIMAACAPTLKPLVGGVLNLSSSGKYNASSKRYSKHSAFTGRRVPGGMLVGSAGTKKGWAKTRSQTDEFEMSSNMYDNLKEPEDQHITSVRAGSPSGSEDDILKSRRTEASHGIMRTVEVTIK
jgi:hypothetical protein